MMMEECRKFEGCNAAICPLDPEQGIHVKGDPVCCFIKDYLEDKDSPFNGVIKSTESVWRAKIRNGQLAKQLKSRQRLRGHWAKNDQEGQNQGVLNGGMAGLPGKTINQSGQPGTTP